MGANVKLAGAMTTATGAMASMNKAMNPQQLSQTMQNFGKASAQMEMTEEMMSDALDDILNESGDEEESDSIVAQVLDEIGIDISSKVVLFVFLVFILCLIVDSLQVAQAPSAPSKLGASTAAANELSDLEKQLAKLKS